MTTDAMLLRIAHVVTSTEAEGPGKRFAVWFQGCPLRCPGCCNPEFLPFSGGYNVPISDLVARIIDAQDSDGIEGISLLGGEPFAHAAGAATVAKAARHSGLGVMVYTGYTLEQIHEMANPAAVELLAHTDLLVDGPYDRALPEQRRRWVGSANQRVHFLTGRYRPDDPCWAMPNTLEIRFELGEVRVNGFPAPAAVALWKGWKRYG